ncbi:MAG: serine/threonine protein kinase/class 3 adenylate cyclase [bacterium]|jgi:serine/threonine protein kinase/class 3 adenylate cyclase
MAIHSIYEGHLFINRYEVRELIGEGGVGQVFLVWDKQTKEERALKLVDIRKKRIPLESLTRFKNEAETLKSIHHESVVKYMDFFEENDVYGLVMEHLPLPTLSEYLKTSDQVPISTIFQLSLVIAEALVFLHKQGFVHHDLKPSNFMVDFSQDKPAVKLLDFGFSQLVSIDEQHIGGTLAYMSPEQTGILKKTIDQRSDLYSFGIILYEMLTGKVPFDSHDPAVLVHQHIAQKPTPPSQIRDNIPPFIEKLVLKLLSKDPYDRYLTTEGLLNDLNRYCRLLKKQDSTLIDFSLGEEDHFNSFLQENPFVGRKKELYWTTKFLDESTDYQKGGLILIEGSSRIGKTAFLNFIYNKLQEKEGKTIFYTIKKEEFETPYSEIKDILGHAIEFLKTQSPTQQELLIEEFKIVFQEKFALFVQLLPELKSWLTIEEYNSKKAWSNEDYRDLFCDYLKLIQKYHQRFVICVDELHSLGESTLNALLGGLEDLTEYPIFIIATYNLQKLPKKLSERVKELSLLDYVKRIVIPPLTERQVTDLVQKLFSDQLNHATGLSSLIYEFGFGNPSYVRSILRILIDQQKIHFNKNRWEFDYKGAQQFLRDEFTTDIVEDNPISGWKKQDQEVLIRGAVFQRAFSFHAIEFLAKSSPKIAKITSEKIIQVIDNAIKEEIVTVDSRKLYSFCDPALKQKLLQKLPNKTKDKLHQHIAKFLTQYWLPKHQDVAYDIAYHWGKTSKYKETVQAYYNAAKITDNGISRSTLSANYYSYAVQVLDQHETKGISVDLEFEIRAKSIQQQLSINQNYEEIWNDVLDLETLVRGKKKRLVEILYLKGLVSFLLGKKEDMYKYSQILFETANRPEDEVYTVQILNMMGRIAGFHSYEERVQQLTKGIELAFKHNVLPFVPTSVSILAILLAYLGRFEEAEQRIHSYFEQLESLNFKSVDLHRTVALFYLEKERGNYREVQHLSDRIEGRLGELVSYGTFLIKSTVAHGMGMLGHYKESLILFEPLLKENVKIEQQMGRSSALPGRIEVALQMDEPETALGFIEELQEIMKYRYDAQRLCISHIFLIHAYTELNQLDNAYEVYEKDALPLCEKLNAKLLFFHLRFAHLKLEWQKHKNEDDLSKVETLLNEMLECGVTGYYELYKEEYHSWANHRSDSSHSYSSVMNGYAEFEELMEINRRITSTLDISSVFDSVLDGAMKITGAMEGYLFICEHVCEYDKHKGILPPLKLTRDVQGNTIPKETQLFSKNILFEVLEGKKGIITRNAKKEKKWKEHQSILLKDLRSILAIPILLKDQIIGVLYLDNHSAASVFTYQDLNIVGMFATQVAIAINNAWMFRKEKAAREKTEKTLQIFEQFVPRQFTKNIAQGDIESLKTGISREDRYSILFSDIRSFTTLSEKMSPTETFQFLNTYLRKMDAPIRKNQGFVDKFIGDAIMALFDQSPDHAVQAALGMLEELEEYNQFRTQNGDLAVNIGIGINTGDVMAGVIGSEERMDTTVLGDAVNIASRVESLTKHYQVPLLVTCATRCGLSDIQQYDLRLIDIVKVKGRMNPTRLFEIYNLDEPSLKEKKEKFYPQFQKGFDAYQEGYWIQAKHEFEEYLKKVPVDFVANIFIERCKLFATIPPTSWNGVFQLDKK